MRAPGCASWLHHCALPAGTFRCLEFTLIHLLASFPGGFSHFHCQASRCVTFCRGRHSTLKLRPSVDRSLISASTHCPALREYTRHAPLHSVASRVAGTGSSASASAPGPSAGTPRRRSSLSISSSCRFASASARSAAGSVFASGGGRDVSTCSPTVARSGARVSSSARLFSFSGTPIARSAVAASAAPNAPGVTADSVI